MTLSMSSSICMFFSELFESLSCLMFSNLHVYHGMELSHSLSVLCLFLSFHLSHLIRLLRSDTESRDINTD